MAAPLFLAGLAAAAGPIVKQVLASLGIGFISYAALAAVAAGVVSHVQTNYGQIPASVIELVNLMGAGQAMGIVLGGIVARAAFGAITRLGKLSS